MMHKCRKTYNSWAGNIIFAEGEYYIGRIVLDDKGHFRKFAIKLNDNNDEFTFRNELDYKEYFYTIQELREIEIDKILI